MNSSGNGTSGSESANDDAVFRSPSASTRGRKRRVASADDSFSNTSSMSAPKRGRPRGSTLLTRGTGRGAGRRNVGGQEFSAGEEKGLFGAVKSGKHLDLVVDEWISEYERVSETAIVKLLQFFISCCGCKGVITMQMVQCMEFSEIIRCMTEDFDEDSGDYPLVMTGPQWKKFRMNLQTIINEIIDKCKSSIIFDQRMMDVVIQLLTGLADSQVRAFRHTATFMAMKLSSSLVDVAMEIVSIKDKNVKQIEAEKAKLKASAGTNDKLDVLLTKKNEIEERIDDVRQMLQYIFKSVFVHRYRDILPDTRGICISELGNWMLVYPDHFLEDSYLKYIGWTLHDKTPEVRLKCVNALLPLYENPVMSSKLELFTNKFKNRLVAMVSDKDYETAVRSCTLLTSIYRVFPSVLQLKDCIPIYELVYSNNRSVAVAAGEFLNTKVFQHNVDDKKSSGQDKNAALIKDLIQFFIEGECHSHATYLVDALIDTNPIIKDWQTQVDLLLGDEMEKMESQLIEVLVCSVRQAATGEAPVGRAIAKRGAPSTKENRQIVEDRTKLSEVLIPVLAQLLQKFIADRDKVACLISIPLYFQLEMYMAARLENNLNELMGVIDIIVEKHADEEMLLTVAEVLTYFTTNTAVAQYTETYRLKLIDGLALQLRHIVQRFMNEESWDEEDDAAMLSSFRRIAAFSSHIDLKKWDLWDVVLNLVTNHEERAPRDVIDKSFWFLSMQLGFDLHRLVNDQDSNKNEALKRVKKRRDQFIHVINTMMKEGAAGVEMGFRCLCDCLFLFNDQLPKDNPSCASLVIHLDNDFISKIQQFVTSNVFTDAGLDIQMDQQERVELMQKKRVILAQYCKMILHGIFKIEDAATVLQYYCSSYTDFGDLLKQLLYKCRDLNFLACSKAVTKVLIDCYENIRWENKTVTVDPLCDAFQGLRDLAKRFSVAFGNDHVKNREAVASVHKDGIQFAMGGFDPQSTDKDNVPPNMSYLEVIIEFSGKLLKQDKASLVKYLEKQGGPLAGATNPGRENIWEPFLLYKNSLSDNKPDDVASVRSFATVASSRGRSGRGRGRGRGVTPTPSDMD
ncbi:unnamed protein product [Auanema sp. JU1783]|nr:unnamed protein product [Auanema sp. JU1783]